ncbi:hypothetical protein COCMIDRAFT_98724 [Bipolaris oryzae ATCC 44560]|uniref:Uncharacterized protein n=1 Tax=Bipolaris oryzae ATCC 44560 TaxID=930090 RepID=W6Z9R7_COCMI|nr:uncharacterized protein COCMIDRAFT_98724 [Bipolaris oryzae ATCC 44560]EUC44259.1 hypothetical protein COCMIDRAFT_98724 [Bipolaris oryzae ATCC 44560]
MVLSDFDIAVSNLNIDQGDTIEDVMNVPFTTVVDAPVRDFATLYPHDQAESDEDEQINRYRRLIEEKLRVQVSAQELESKMAATKDITDRYAAQASPNTNKPSPPTPPPFHTRRASEPTLSPNTSSAITTPPKAPCNTPSSPTPNSLPPSKHRRNPDSRNIDFRRPRHKVEEEEEGEEEEEEEDLEQYRTMDLAPLEPIMQSSSAGDLITYGTPIKVRDVDIFRVAG